MIDDVICQLRDYGLLIETLDTTGKLTHVRVEGNKGSKKSGWYVCWRHILPSGREYINGAYGNYKLSDDKQIIQQESSTLTADERQKMQADRWRQQQEYKVIEKARWDAAEKRAKTIWENLPQGGACKYLDRKKIKPFGIRFGRNSIAVPVRRINDGNLVGMQFIQGDGSKKLLTGTRKKGACHLIGDWSGATSGTPAVAVEGYATGASIHMATGWPVAVMFDTGNLVASLALLKSRYPALSFLVAGDNDTETAGNPGLKAALKAATSIRCAWTLPQFQEAG